ncbi:hypothetical protein HPB48_004870 [Haemaphysalis longicornis]|uniref:Elongation of very long chain fatty acids protein n=1 Tax=Haemaphysalis longicornis TaxID=44386 RepID=A0A9J6GV81_HAELO|nr:hypothetical protein HPB48_004870 [Haemaphysalis longicornis]
MGSPVPVVTLIGFYLLLATRLGPRWMRDREPFNIRGLVVAYNVLMVALSGYFIYFAIAYAGMRRPGQSLLCWATDPSPSAENMFFLTRAWYYMLMKLGEMLDTVFFVLRKKTNHLSFLHLLHHSLALWSVWLVLTLGITGHVFLLPTAQLGCSRGHVRLLRPGRYGPSAPAQPLVEKVRDVLPRSPSSVRLPCTRSYRRWWTAECPRYWHWLVP